MNTRQIDTTCLINGLRVRRCANVTLNRGRYRQFTLADGSTVTSPVGGRVSGASRPRRDLPAGPVRPVKRPEALAAIRDSKQEPRRKDY